VEPIGEYITNIGQALSDELNARSVFPKKSTLMNGARISVSDESALYRFEIPENFLFEPSLNVRCTLGTKLQFTFPGLVADVHHQFAYFLIPLDAGEMISEMTCEWNPSEEIALLSKRYETMQQKDIVTRLFTRSFSDNARPTSKEPIFPSTFTESQRNAVRKSLARKISVVIGEKRRGKTEVASSLMLNVLREGKRVLYLTSSSGGLHDCMQEIVVLNSAVAEESVVVIDSGILLLSPLPMPLYPMKGSDSLVYGEGLKKFIKIIVAEYEYDRVDALVKKREEKQRQIEDASSEAEEIQARLQRLQNASMLERMKQGINKADIDSAQLQLRDKLALVERFKQHAATLLKEQFKQEAQLPVPLKEKKELEKLASTRLSLQTTFPSTTTAARCVAMTVHEALKLEKTQLGEFDVVCIDDAHALNLAEFFWCASHAQEQCFILADITEQPPQSVSQLATARKWLQKNYFTFYQQEESDHRRFTIGSLPENTASELINPEYPPSLFESCLTSALYQSPVPQGAKGRIFFINTEDSRSVSAQYLGKKKILPYNEANAKRVIECVKHALVNGTTSQSDILIVVPPSGQETYLRDVLKAHQMNSIEIAALGSIRLCTKRTVIFDTTVAGIDFTLRSLDDKKSGIVRVADTFNTLLSTVGEDLYVIADLLHFSKLYKDRLITTLLGIFKSRSENIGNILNGVRRFDELTPEVRKAVLGATAEGKQSADYQSTLERAKLSVSDAAKSGTQQSIALAERKLRNDVRSIILRVLAKREVINVVAQYLEGFPLYKTTLETTKYSSSLPELECENENDFKNVMNMWNVLIYESSSAQKINHPLASKARVDAKISNDIQDIYMYYHSDLEFVVEVGKHKLAQSIQKIFNDCIGRKPVTPTDWMNAYLVFLGRMEKYLDAVNNQIRA
jgi:hypothetical protein